MIGEQLARANEAEQSRLSAGDYGPSPMAAATYDGWRGELNLVDPRPLPLDAAIGELSRSFSTSDSNARAGIRRSINLPEFYTLLAFAERTAVFAMREQSVDLLVDGLNAIAMIEAERVDYRDILGALSLLHHAAMRIGADADGLFGHAAALSEPNVAGLLTEFAARPPETRALRDAWGRDEVQTEHGVGFIRWGFRPYDPTYDLKAIALQFAAVLDADRYQSDDPELAIELPKVWLRGGDNGSLDETLRAVRAGVGIHGRLRPAASPTHARQQLSIFLVELANESQADNLLRMSKAPSESFCALGVAKGRLFCLTVARSVWQGVESYETRESLARLGPSFVGILERYAGGETGQ